MRHILPHQGYLPICEKLGVPPAEHEQLIAGYLNGLVSPPQPHIRQMVGIPGSGKTTFVRELNTPNTLVLGCDDVMESLSGYQKDKSTLGNKDAFQKWELCAREIAYEILFQGVDLGLNIVMDFNSANPAYIAMLRHMKEQRGYEVSVTAMIVDESTALERIQNRDRYVPPEYIPARKKIIEGLLPEYKTVADHYEERVTSNRGETPAQQRKQRKPAPGNNNGP